MMLRENNACLRLVYCYISILADTGISSGRSCSLDVNKFAVLYTLVTSFSAVGGLKIVHIVCSA